MNNIKVLNKEEFFKSILNDILNIIDINVSVPVVIYNHDFIKGHKKALGITHFEYKGGLPLKITIDEYFVEECYKEYLGIPFGKQMRELAGDTLEGVICHELAHLTHLRHGKKHREETQRLLNLCYSNTEKLKVVG